MFNLPTGIIKNTKVRRSGAVMVGRNAGRSPRAAGHGGEPTARIVGQNDSGAIIEIMCSCGQTVQVVCEFPTAMAAEMAGVQ